MEMVGKDRILKRGRYKQPYGLIRTKKNLTYHIPEPECCNATRANAALLLYKSSIEQETILYSDGPQWRRRRGRSVTPPHSLSPTGGGGGGLEPQSGGEPRRRLVHERLAQRLLATSTLIKAFAPVPKAVLKLSARSQGKVVRVPQPLSLSLSVRACNRQRSLMQSCSRIRTCLLLMPESIIMPGSL
jgi:hypothetical protein